MNLYCKTKWSVVTDLGSLRWHLFSKYQLDSSNLPPTQRAFEQFVLRAHYTASQWKSSHIQKIINDLAPSYLKDLIPPNHNASYGFRKIRELHLLAARTGRFQATFFNIVFPNGMN